ncbi:MAG: hypothetical protein WBF39_17745 [Planococcus donghaensis]
MEKYIKRWSLSEFSKELLSRFSLKTGKEEKVHNNTVTNWFNSLESQNIHYVPKSDDIRQFDELDLEIALFIMEMRKENWQLDAIFKIIPRKFDVRPQEPRVMTEEETKPYQEGDLLEVFYQNLKQMDERNRSQNLGIINYLELNNKRSNKLSELQSLQLEKKDLQIDLTQLENKLDNVDLRKEYLEILSLKQKSENAGRTKNKGFFAKLFSGPDSDQEEEIESDVSTEQSDKLSKLDEQRNNLVSKMAHIKREIENKEKQISVLSKEVESDYSQPLVKAKEKLLIETQEKLFEKGESDI